MKYKFKVGDLVQLHNTDWRARVLKVDLGDRVGEGAEWLLLRMNGAITAEYYIARYFDKVIDFNQVWDNTCI